MSDYDDQQLDAEREEQLAELEAKEELWPTTPDLKDVLPPEEIGKHYENF